MGIQRGHKARPLEWLTEKMIAVVSLSAIVVVFLIFMFVAREALPIFLGQMDSALVQPTVPATEMDKLSADQLRRYLGLTKKELGGMSRETLLLLMEAK